MSNVYIGVDIGGTNTEIGLFDESLQLQDKTTIPTSKPHFPNKTNDPRQYLDELADEIQRVVSASIKRGARLAGVGMGVPGRVNAAQGIALGASNLGWYDVPIAEEMSKRLGTIVRVDNDVRIYTLGEVKAGAAKGYRHIICVTLGTGLAAGIMINGQIVTGSDWYAGELGHDRVEGHNALCNCGQRGCLETITSASGIARLGQEAAAGEAATSLKMIQGRITSLDVYRAAQEGDQVAAGIFRFVGTVLGRKLATAVYLLNPEAIIIGGGASAAGELLIGPVRETIYERYPQGFKPLVAAGQLGATAGLFGAVHYAVNYGRQQ